MPTEPTLAGLLEPLTGSVVFNTVDDVYASNLKQFRDRHLDTLVYWSVFHSDPRVRGVIHWLVRHMAQMAGVVPASAERFFRLRGEGKYVGAVVPVLTLPGSTYDTARAVFRAALESNARTFVLAPSGPDWDAFSARVSAAALREGFAGPLFLATPEITLDAARFGASPEEETGRVDRELNDAVAAGLLNLDLDTTGLYVAGAVTVEEYLRPACDQVARFARTARALQKDGTKLALGARVAAMGNRAAGLDDVRNFLDLTLQALGTTLGKHGGVSRVTILHDGERPVAPQLLKEISDLTSGAYGMSGVFLRRDDPVGDADLSRYSEVGLGGLRLTAQVTASLARLAPVPDVDRTETRVWELDHTVRASLCAGLEKTFESLFRRLSVSSTLDAVVDNIDAVKVWPAAPDLFRKWVTT
jgi:hypothetical protein